MREPMTWEQAFAWLTAGQSPAGAPCSGSRARQLLAWARDAGAVHMTKGPDLRAPGWLLSRNPGTGLFEVLAAVPEKPEVEGEQR